jgi:hypothetical protein
MRRHPMIDAFGQAGRSDRDQSRQPGRARSEQENLNICRHPKMSSIAGQGRGSTHRRIRRGTGSQYSALDPRSGGGKPDPAHHHAIAACSGGNGNAGLTAVAGGAERVRGIRRDRLLRRPTDRGTPAEEIVGLMAELHESGWLRGLRKDIKATTRQGVKA